jgi:Sap, sulfolipid-1-addressing protein
MAQTLVRTLLYALLAAASPTALTATLVVLRSRQARLNGFLFATAFVLGSLVVVVIVLVLGATGPSENSKSAVAGALALLLGVLLLAAAWRARHALPARRTETSGRTQALLDRLARLNAAGAFSIGAALGVGGPKRLTVSIIAATTISAAGLSRAADARLSTAYVVVASVLVWVPVALYLVAGPRAREWLDDGEDWLKTHRHEVTMVLLIVFGVALVADGLSELL